MVKKMLCAALTAFALAGCATGAVAVNDAKLTPADCGTDHVHKLITYCVAPEAADFARRNAELMGAAAATGDVPYSPLPVGDSPVRGAATAPVTIVMFTDLECPYCQSVHATLEELRAASPDQLRIVFKHTPLNFHEFAVPAALGALAAGEQGKFWEYVDLVYANQATLDEHAMLTHAATLQLDLEKFRTDFGSAEHVAAIEADLALASQVGVQGTPTMFVNGIRVVGVYPAEQLSQLFNQQQELVDRFAAAGVPRDDLYWRMVAVQYQQEPPSNIDQPAPEQPGPTVVHIPVDGTPIRGAAADDALVTIVEFSDFQCPFCARATDALTVLLEDASDVRLSFRHFPLDFHPMAGPAALGSLLAQDAGKFWEFHDLVFANQETLSLETLKEHLVAVGIEGSALDEAIRDTDFHVRVVTDQDLGIKTGVRGTPTFLVNGIFVVGMSSPEEFAAMVEEQRQIAAAVKAETGLSGDALYEAVVRANVARFE